MATEREAGWRDESTNEHNPDDIEFKATKISEEASKFLKRKDIRGLLIAEVYNQGEAIEEQFIILRSIENIWTTQVLTEFLAVLGLVGGEKPVMVVQTSLLKTISILVHTKWEHWSRFKSIFFPDGWTGPVHQDRTDKAIPHPLNVLKEGSFLGTEAAGDFFNNQNAYMPAVIVQGSTDIISRTRPLPFIKEKHGKIAVGGFGFVTKEVIAPDHICLQSPYRGELTPHPKEFVVARKRFQVRGDFRKETENLASLAESLSKHDRLVKHLAFITTGDERDRSAPRDFNILLPMADTDLSKLLYDREFKPQGLDIVLLFKEALGLADALFFLHNSLVIRSKPQVFCHMDLKLDNILVYDLKDPNSPVGCWKISDFGISAMIEPRDNGQLLDQSEKSPAGTIAFIRGQDPLLTSKKRQPGTYSAPEVHLPDGRVGPPGDIWSFGCILFQILARGAGGIEFLKKMDDARSPPHRGGHDHFCQEDEAGEAILHHRVKRWLDRTDFFGHTEKRDEKIILGCKAIIKQALEVRQEKRATAEQIRMALPTICERDEYLSESLFGSVIGSIRGQPIRARSTFPMLSPHQQPQSPRLLADIQVPQPEPFATQVLHPSQRAHAPLDPNVPSHTTAVNGQRHRSFSPTQPAPTTHPDDHQTSPGLEILSKKITIPEKTKRHSSTPLPTEALPRKGARRPPPIPNRVSSHGEEVARPISASSSQPAIPSPPAINGRTSPSNNLKPLPPTDATFGIAESNSREHIVLANEQRRSITDESRYNQSAGQSLMVSSSAPPDDPQRGQFNYYTGTELSSSPPDNNGAISFLKPQRLSPFSRSMAKFTGRFEKARSQAFPQLEVTSPTTPSVLPPKIQLHPPVAANQPPAIHTSNPGPSALSSRHTPAQGQLQIKGEEADTEFPHVPRQYTLNAGTPLQKGDRQIKGSVSSEASSGPQLPPLPMTYWTETHMQHRLARRRSRQSSVPSVNVGSTNTYSFLQVEKETTTTLISSTTAKIAFIAPNCVHISTLYEPHCTDFINAPSDVSWQRGSLAGNYLALRGYHTLNQTYLFHLYELTMSTAREGYPTLILEHRKIEHARLPDFEKFDVSRDGRLLIGDHNIIYLAHSLEEEPFELQPNLKSGFNLQRVWFSTSGLIAFAWSSGPGNKHRVNWWEVNNLQRLGRLRHQDSEGSTTPDRIRIIHFPTKPLCLLLKDDYPHLMQDAKRPSALKFQSCQLVGIQAVVVTPNEDAVVFIRSSASTLRRPPVSKICVCRIRKSGDFFYLDEWSKEERLQIYIKDQKTCEVVIEEEYEGSRNSVRVLIAQSDGKFEVKNITLPT